MHPLGLVSSISHPVPMAMVATSGNVAMAAGNDSEPTPAMIAAGLSQLPPMDETFAHLVETVEAVYRAMRKVARAGEH